jgi:hypothetical protein
MHTIIDSKQDTKASSFSQQHVLKFPEQVRLYLDSFHGA